MVRFVTGRALVALLGLAGLAMAQDDIIIDPWKRVVAALGASNAALRPANDRTGAPVTRSAVTREQSNARPSVVPIGPALNAGERSAVVPIGPVTGDEVVDPWLRPSKQLQPWPNRPLAHGGRTDWAREIDEIVDP